MKPLLPYLEKSLLKSLVSYPLAKMKMPPIHDADLGAF